MNLHFSLDFFDDIIYPIPPVEEEKDDKQKEIDRGNHKALENLLLEKIKLKKADIPTFKILIYKNNPILDFSASLEMTEKIQETSFKVGQYLNFNKQLILIKMENYEVPLKLTHQSAINFHSVFPHFVFKYFKRENLDQEQVYFYFYNREDRYYDLYVTEPFRPVLRHFRKVEIEEIEEELKDVVNFWNNQKQLEKDLIDSYKLAINQSKKERLE
jgi:hypothetical protein